LLPVRLGQLGPGISWIDLDRDGGDDLLIASGKGGRAGVYRNEGNGTFSPANLHGQSRPAPGDQTAMLGWSLRNGTTVITGNANYEQGNIQAPSAYRHRMQRVTVAGTDSLPYSMGTTGPMAASDYDGDGDLDLFVGGRFIPGHYPMDAPSRLFINEQGSFIPDEANGKKLQRGGLVTGAIFTDYDRDGDQDLIFRRCWGSDLVPEN